MTSLGTYLHTLLSGSLLGTDEFGNRYYESKKKPSSAKRKRWVLYKGVVEASKIPPDWHAWIHYTTDQIPSLKKNQAKPWIKDHLPNLSGTDYSYRPPGHVSKGARRSKATGDYEPWTPKS